MMERPSQTLKVKRKIISHRVQLSNFFFLCHLSSEEILRLQDKIYQKNLGYETPIRLGVRSPTDLVGTAVSRTAMK